MLTKARVPDGVEGVARLHEMVATHAEDPSEVVIGIEIDRGLPIGALVAAGYAVHAINPLSVDRYRDRHRGGALHRGDRGRDDRADPRPRARSPF